VLDTPALKSPKELLVGSNEERELNNTAFSDS